MMVILQNIRKAIAFFTFFTCISVFSQTTYDFTSGLTLYSTGGWTNNMAKFTVNGVEYTIDGGINGSLSNPSEGVSNSKCLKKSTAGGDTFTLRRTDGQAFQFYGLWVKQTGMNSYHGQFGVTLPPFYTMTASDDCNVIVSYNDNSPMVGGSSANTTTTYTWSIANGVTVTSVQISYKAALYWWIDNIIVGAAQNNNTPNLTTANASSVTATTAILGGNIASTQNSMDYGIVWSSVNTTPDYSGVNNNVVSMTAGSGGNFSGTVTFTGVPTGTTIYYRAFSDNWNCGTVEYGATKSFILSGALNTVETPPSNEFSLFPNPTNGYFQIKGLNKKTKLSIIDATGKSVLEKEVTPNEEISTDKLSKGLYFVKVGNSTLKLIKK